MTNKQITEYLREPATAQQRLNALVVHSLGSIRQEEELAKRHDNRAEAGYLSVPVGSNMPLVGK